MVLVLFARLRLRGVGGDLLIRIDLLCVVDGDEEPGCIQMSSRCRLVMPCVVVVVDMTRSGGASFFEPQSTRMSQRRRPQEPSSF